MPLALRAISTWLVIGPVSRVFKSANGGCPSNTWVLPVRCGDVGTERAGLRNPADDFVIGNRDDYGLWCKGRADIAVFAVGGEDRHARTVGYGNPCLLLVSCAVQYGDVVLTANDHPHFFAVHRKERFVRRAPNISYVL